MAVKATPTQAFVPIKEVRDGIIIEKDGGMRAILLASSLNFSLKSESEKNAILLQFQDFLNSLDFSIQIVVQSRKLDIRPYLSLLEEQGKLQVNDLMRIQIREYIEFIRSFTESTNIMTKSFFIVVPYSPNQITKDSGLASFISRSNPKDKAAAKESSFEESRTQLEERLAVVEQGVVRTGVRIARLGTDEIIELFYKAFNPGETERAVSKK